MDKFVSAETRSFSHVYLSPEEHGDNLNAAAQNILSKLENENEDWNALGDPFMLKRGFKSLNALELTRLFGPTFSKGLFELEGNKWQGPIESAFGLHLIRIDNIADKITPSFEDVRDDVETAWQEDASRSANQPRLKSSSKNIRLMSKMPLKVMRANDAGFAWHISVAIDGYVSQRPRSETSLFKSNGNVTFRIFSDMEAACSGWSAPKNKTDLPRRVHANNTYC